MNLKTPKCPECKRTRLVRVPFYASGQGRTYAWWCARCHKWLKRESVRPYVPDQARA